MAGAGQSGPGLGLRARLLLLTVGFVLLAELLIFPPSAANARRSWVHEQIQAAEVAALAIEAAPDRTVSDELSHRLMQETGMLALAVGEEEMRELIFAPSSPIEQQMKTIELGNEMMAQSIFATFEHMLAPSGRVLRVINDPILEDANYIDLIMPEAALKQELWRYSKNILLLSLLISALTGGLVYFAVYRLMVKPVLRITDAVSNFADAPEQLADFQPSQRRDEIGAAEKALQEMQETVSSSFRQKKRLADLGEAVAKINHDLRNSLAVAQIVSDTVNKSDDPIVRKAAPRLERALERAIGLAESTLRYGRAESKAPRLQTTRLAPLADEALREGLTPVSVDWIVDVEEDYEIQTDPDHLHRILSNLARNAGKAIDEHGASDGVGLVTLSAREEPERVIISVADNGPGVPEHLKDRLFQPFKGSESRDGSGLGLAIARELARALDGDVSLAESVEQGAVFEVSLRA